MIEVMQDRCMSWSFFAITFPPSTYYKNQRQTSSPFSLKFESLPGRNMKELIKMIVTVLLAWYCYRMAEKITALEKIASCNFMEMKIHSYLLHCTVFSKIKIHTSINSALWYRRVCTYTSISLPFYWLEKCKKSGPEDKLPLRARGMLWRYYGAQGHHSEQVDSK